MKRIYGVLVLLFIGVILVGCGLEEETSSNTGEDVLTVYTTLYPIEYFTKEIGGSRVDVQSILPAGADAHTYEPTSKTMVDIAVADAFIYNGAQLEAYAEKMKEALKDESVLLVEATNGVPLLDNNEAEHAEDHENHAHEEKNEEHVEDHKERNNKEITHNHHHGDVDPHVWLDPIRSISLAENIKDALIQLKPAYDEEFEENFEQLKARLTKLDQDFHSEIELQKHKEILVTHAAYGYWEHAYGLKQVAISGISPSEQPSQKKLEQVIENVEGHGIEYILFEQNVESSVADIIQQETGVESLYIHNLSVLTEDDRKDGKDYFTLMYQNLDALVTSLKH